MAKLNGGKKKRLHNCMDVNVAIKYIRQHIELFGSEIYTFTDDTYNNEPNNHAIPHDSLNNFKASIENCEKCNLSLTRNKFVFGSGDPDADLMLIGEGPGKEEDSKGEPFVGQAGKLLDKILKAIGYVRYDNVFIANIVKCRPPENRNPLPSEIEKCTPYLKDQINLIKPKLIVALGKVAGQTLLNENMLIKEMRKKTHRYNSIPLIITYHPAALLRNPSLKLDVWGDFQYIRGFMKP
tara:strand:- start:5183 stop:5896 length:714 start_codon:yes stop_codon:yes gene_type:complete